MASVVTCKIDLEWDSVLVSCGCDAFDLVYSSLVQLSG